MQRDVLFYKNAHNKCIEIKLEIDVLFEQKEYEKIWQILEYNRDEITLDSDLSLFYYLVELYNAEKNNQLEFTIFTKSQCIQDVIGRFTELKFKVRRIEFDLPDALKEFYIFVVENHISALAIYKSVYFACINTELVLNRIKEGA